MQLVIVRVFRSSLCISAAAACIFLVAAWQTPQCQAQEQGAPHGLIKTAIFTRVYGKPTIPNIMKLVKTPAAATPTRKMGPSDPPAINGRPAAGGQQRMVPVRSAAYQASAVQSPSDAASMVNELPVDEISCRTFSYHYPWYYGTNAGSFPPEYFPNYVGYFGGAYPYYGWGRFRFGGYGYAGYGYGYGYSGGYPFYSGYGTNFGYGGFGPYASAGLFGYTPLGGFGGYGPYGGFAAYGPSGYGGGYPGFGPGAGYGGCYYW